jgi:hypothetical protein
MRHGDFLESLSKEQLLFYHRQYLASAPVKATPSKLSANPQIPLTRHAWDTPTGNSFPSQPSFALEGDNTLRRAYPDSCFTLTQMGENIISTRSPAHLIYFCQQPSLRSGESSIVFGSDHKLKTAVNNVFFSSVKDISTALDAWAALSTLYGQYGAKEVQGINQICAAIKMCIDGNPKRPDIVLSVFHKMMSHCLGGASPPGFSKGMPIEATSVYNFMVITPSFPAADLSVYAHLSDILLRILPQSLKAELLVHHFPGRVSAALRGKESSYSEQHPSTFGTSKPSSSKDSNRSEICRNFNFHKSGCLATKCRYAHRCASCNSSSHSNNNCSKPLETNSAAKAKRSQDKDANPKGKGQDVK